MGCSTSFSQFCFEYWVFVWFIGISVIYTIEWMLVWRLVELWQELHWVCLGRTPILIMWILLIFEYDIFPSLCIFCNILVFILQLILTFPSFIFMFVPHLAVLRTHFRLCDHGSLLVWSGESYSVQGTELRSATCNPHPLFCVCRAHLFLEIKKLAPRLETRELLLFPIP